jgi:hypothetical protein
MSKNIRVVLRLLKLLQKQEYLSGLVGYLKIVFDLVNYKTDFMII